MRLRELRATNAPTGLAPRTRVSRLDPRGGEEKRRRRHPGCRVSGFRCRRHPVACTVVLSASVAKARFRHLTPET
jgi:hypothetical protein